MSQKVQILRSLVEQRLTAAAEEIFGMFERTIAEYEEELFRTKEENQRQRQILDTVLLHTPVGSADAHQHSVVKEEVPPKQKDWRPSVDQNQNQEDPKNHHIKEEQEELWTNQEADITEFPSTSVPVKSEDEEKAQSSWLRQRQTEKNREETDVEDFDRSEPASSLDPHRHLQPVCYDNSSDSNDTEASVCDWTGTHRTQSRSKRGKTITLTKADNGLSTKERPFPCSYCGKTFTLKGNLSRHMRYHTGEKPFTCSVCTKCFHVKEHLNRHMKVHTGEKPFSCHICGKCSAAKGDLTKHMRVHTREKPYICSVCGKSFAETGHLKRHMKLHTTD